MSKFIVVYDACVLYPAPLRDLLLRLAEAGVVEAKWTDEILDETFRSITRGRPDLDPTRLERTRRMMCEAVPGCIVTGYQNRIPALTLPDPDDRHVLAAAIEARAQAIVTFNLKDFPVELLGPQTIDALHPDDFVLDRLRSAPGAILAILYEQAGALRSPPRTVIDVLVALEGNGLVRSAAAVRSLIDPR